MSNIPTPKAMLFTVYGRECAIYLENFDVQYSVRLVYKDGDKWLYIKSGNVLTFNSNTKEKAKDEYKKVLVDFSKALFDLFSLDTDEPELGPEYINWLISQTVFDGELKL